MSVPSSCLRHRSSSISAPQKKASESASAQGSSPLTPEGYRRGGEGGFIPSSEVQLRPRIMEITFRPIFILFSSFCPFLPLDSQGHGLCQGKRAAGQGWEGTSWGLTKEFWTKESQSIPARGLMKIWLRNSSSLSSIRLY